jgi:hypothetical protein
VDIGKLSKNLVNWYIKNVMKVYEQATHTDLQFLTAFVEIEDPKRLHNCLDSLEQLTWADLRFRANLRNYYDSDTPYLLQTLIDKGIHFNDVLRP